MKMYDQRQKRKRGRPETRVMRIDASPERIARAMFAAVEPPNPSRRLDTLDAKQRTELVQGDGE